MAEQDKIGVECFPLAGTSALSVELQGQCYVGIDPFQLTSAADETVKLAHELGHCKQGGFYRRTSPYELRGRCELLADRWAVAKLVPRKQFFEALHEGCVELWLLAERFGVTEEFMQKAVEFHLTGDCLE